jgi:hypothetical protein
MSAAKVNEQQMVEALHRMPALFCPSRIWKKPPFGLA